MEAVLYFFRTMADLKDGWSSFIASLAMNALLLFGIIFLNGLCASCADLVENLHLALIGGYGTNELELNTFNRSSTTAHTGDEDSI